MTGLDVRVCPRCGNPSDSHPFCPECGLDLRSQPELPTRSQWMQANLPPPPAAPAPSPQPPPSPQPASAPPPILSTPQPVTAPQPAPPPIAAPGAPQPLTTPPGLAAPVAAASSRRRFPVPVPVLIGVVAVLVVVIGFVVASGGGDDGLGRQAVETRLEEVLAASPYGADDPSVSCPDGIDIATGEEFDCDASAADGSSVTIEVTVEDAEGNGEFSIGNLVHVQAIANECQQELSDLVDSAGIANECTLIDCPDLMAAEPGGTLSCEFTLDSGDRGTIDIPLNDDGVTHEGPWEATEGDG